MNIAIIELEHRGHHLSLYLKSIAQEILSKGHTLFVITTHDAKKSGLITHLKKKNVNFFYTQKIKYPKKNNFFNLLKFQINNFLLIRNIFNKIVNNLKVDHVYINTLDHFDKAISFLGSPFGETPFSCLYLNPKFYNDELFNLKKDILKNSLYRLLFFFLITNKKLKNLFLIDPLYTTKLRNKYQFAKKKIVGIRDFSSFSNKYILKKRSFNNKIKNILLFGSIKFNKGIFELLSFFKNYKKNKFRILIVGKLNHDVKFFIKKLLLNSPHLKKKLLVVDKYLKSDSSCMSYFRKADYVWVGYSDNFYGSSGVFFSACKMKKPVIVSSNGLINWYNSNEQITMSELRKLIIKGLKLLIKNIQ